MRFKKMYGLLFPSNRKEWKKYMTYLVTTSYVFRTIMYALLFIVVVITYPLTRMELQLRVKNKQKEDLG